jgi:hypothetical protein
MKARVSRILLVVWLTGCYQPHIVEGVPCGADQTCPVEFRCIENVCVREALDRDASSIDDGDDAVSTPPLAERRLTTATGRSEEPVLVWTGSELAIAWREARSGANEIYFARFGADGARLGNEVPVTATGLDSSQPSLVWTGTAYGLAWRDARDGNNEIYFTRIDAAGSLGAALRITADAAASDRPSIAWTGSEFAIAFRDARDGNNEIYLARVDAAGAEIGTEQRLTNDAANSDRAALVWTGSELGVAWRDERDGNSEIYMQRMTATGAPLQPAMRLTVDPATSDRPSLVWTGSEYGVAWHDARGVAEEVYFARISGAGSKLGGDLRISDHDTRSNEVSLAWNGASFGLAWKDQRDGNEEIYFSKLDAAGDEQIADRRITSAPTTSKQPSLVAAATWVVVWSDDRDGSPDAELYIAGIAP